MPLIATPNQKAQRWLRRGLVCALCLISLPVTQAGANGQVPNLVNARSQRLLSGDDPITLAPGLDEVAVSSPTYDRATELVATLAVALQAAQKSRADSAATLLVLQVREVGLTSDMLAAAKRVRAARSDIGDIRAALQELAVANYVNGNGQTDLTVEGEISSDRHNELGTQQVLVKLVNGDKAERLELAENRRARALKQLDDLTGERGSVRASELAMTRQRNQAVKEVARLGPELIAAVPKVTEARRLATVDSLDFPLVVLDAYVKAAELQAKESPRCGIEWWALAGIGLTESRHGTFGGATVKADGQLTRNIVGIPLDGNNETAVVVGPGGFDRAQGPMQFISSTWSRWGRDGNEDGQRDVQNLYDAAAGAAAYLCASGPMRNDNDLRRGYFSYNHSEFYVALVLSQARGYQRALKISAAPEI